MFTSQIAKEAEFKIAQWTNLLRQQFNQGGVFDISLDGEVPPGPSHPDPV